VKGAEAAVAAHNTMLREVNVKKTLALFLSILFFTTGVLFAQGPFGLEMGMNLEEVTEVLGEAPTPNAVIGKKTLIYGYRVSAAKTPAEFEYFTLTITPKAGLCEIWLRTGEFPPGQIKAQSSDPKVEYQKLIDMVSSQYGPPTKEACIPEGEDPFDGDPLDLARVWKPGKHGLEKITLGWIPTSLGSIMSMLYVFDNRVEAIKEYPLKQKPHNTP
jgi:hypothetical protein